MVTTTGTRLPRLNDRTTSSGTTIPTLLPPVGSRTVRKLVMARFSCRSGSLRCQDDVRLGACRAPQRSRHAGCPRSARSGMSAQHRTTDMTGPRTSSRVGVPRVGRLLRRRLDDLVGFVCAWAPTGGGVGEEPQPPRLHGGVAGAKGDAEGDVLGGGPGHGCGSG